MPTAVNGDIEICYETFGDRQAPPLLLVMGLGAQMIAWSDDWCSALAGADRFVIRFDNRDCGLSTKLAGVRVDLPAVLAAWEGQGEMPPAPSHGHTCGQCFLTAITDALPHSLLREITSLLIISSKHETNSIG